MNIIEETREYAKVKVGEYDYLGNEYEAYLDGAQDVAAHIMSLPLSDRLTAEEREKIKAEYAQTHPEDLDCDFVSVCMSQLLERIFGKEMFVEGGGSDE